MKYTITENKKASNLKAMEAQIKETMNIHVIFSNTIMIILYILFSNLILIPITTLTFFLLTNEILVYNWLFLLIVAILFFGLILIFYYLLPDKLSKTIKLTLQNFFRIQNLFRILIWLTFSLSIIYLVNVLLYNLSALILSLPMPYSLPSILSNIFALIIVLIVIAITYGYIKLNHKANKRYSIELEESKKNKSKIIEKKDKINNDHQFFIWQ